VKIDLTSTAGFPLELDTEAHDIVTGDGIRFDRVVRRKLQMKAVLKEPDSIGDNAEMYFNFELASTGRYAQVFHRYNLTFACVLLPPLKVGSEYVKTHGHYHPNMPGSAIAYPEVYTLYYGRLYLLLQRRIDDDPARLNDCVLYEMQPGRSITIPPGYLHVLINPTDEPALMAGLYCVDSYPQYEPVIQMKGAAFYLVEGNGGVQVVANTHYTVCPPLVRLDDLTDSPFAPPCGEAPLWSSYVNKPEIYAMLSDPAAALRRFRPEDLNKTD
jgi:glucose-6-phosphate isomerase, archaeal